MLGIGHRVEQADGGDLLANHLLDQRQVGENTALALLPRNIKMARSVNLSEVPFYVK
jgi:hypothetical protein